MENKRLILECHYTSIGCDSGFKTFFSLKLYSNGMLEYEEGTESSVERTTSSTMSKEYVEKIEKIVQIIDPPKKAPPGAYSYGGYSSWLKFYLKEKELFFEWGTCTPKSFDKKLLDFTMNFLEFASRTGS
jgi:hypothetical protein